MSKHLILMRGHSGSGKSTRAALLRNNLLAYRPKATFGIFSADDYFIESDGVYRWVPERTPDSHKRCQALVREALTNTKLDFVFVDNTNIHFAYTVYYARMASRLGYSVWAHQTTGNFQNIHNVPLHAVMRQRAELGQWPLDLFCECHVGMEPGHKVNILRDTAHFQEIIQGNSGPAH